jgi:long-chain fatty acid transport protein
MKLNRMLAATLSACISLGISASADAVLSSVKTFGMAATGVAYPQDALAAAFNPAGAVEICDRIDVGFTWAQDKGHSRVHGNTLPPELLGEVNGTFNGFKQSNAYSPDFGINKRLGCDNEWAVGFVVFNRNYNKTTYHKPFVLLGTSPAGLEYIQETASAVIAYRINECHNIGLNINLQGERLKVDGLENFDNPLFEAFGLTTVRPGHVTNRGYDYAFGWGVTLGWQWHVIDGLTIGLTYQPETSMTKLKKYDGFIHKGKLNVPAIYSGGIAWRFCDSATVAFDVQHYAWNDVRNLHKPLLHKEKVDDVEVEVLEPLGSKNGPGFGFRNQTFYRLGVDYMINCDWTIRAGYRYGNTPIRKTQTVVNQLVLDTPEHFVTCGFSYRPNENSEISGFFAWGFEKTIKGKESIPEGLPPPFPPPNGFGGGNADLQDRKLAVGLSWGWYY